MHPVWANVSFLIAVSAPLDSTRVWAIPETSLFLSRLQLHCASSDCLSKPLVMPIHIWNLWIYTGMAVHHFSSNFKIILDHHIKISFSSDFIWPKKNMSYHQQQLYSSYDHYYIITFSFLNEMPPKQHWSRTDPFPVCEVPMSLFPWYSEILLSKLLSCSRYCNSDFTLLKTVYISTSLKMKCNES